MSSEILVVENLNVYCPLILQKRQAELLKNINLVVKQNDIVGLAGETGSGKSVLLDAIGCNLTPPLWLETEKLSINLGGEVVDLVGKDEGELRKVWGTGMAFIPPNARDKLNPVLTVGEQFSNIIRVNSKLTKEKAHEKVVDMFRVVQMPDPERNYDSLPDELSGGMVQRVVISIALSMSPKLLLADEPTMGLDVTIQAQVLDLMANLIRKLGSSAILATRDLGIVANYCNKVVVMYGGQIVEFAGVRDFFKKPVHPYSRYLLEMAFASHGVDKGPSDG